MQGCTRLRTSYSLSLRITHLPGTAHIWALSWQRFYSFLLLIPAGKGCRFEHRRLAAMHCVLTSAGCRRGADSCKW